MTDAKAAPPTTAAPTAAVAKALPADAIGTANPTMFLPDLHYSLVTATGPLAALGSAVLDMDTGRVVGAAPGQPWALDPAPAPW